MASDDDAAADEPGFDLAPPPSFGVGERGEGHMLPVATDMGEILGGDEDELGEGDASPRVEPAASQDRASPIEGLPVPFPTLVADPDESDSLDAAPSLSNMVAEAPPLGTEPEPEPAPAPARAQTGSRSAILPAPAPERSGSWSRLIIVVLLLALGAAGVALVMRGDGTAPAASAGATPATSAQAVEPGARVPGEEAMEPKLAQANDIAQMKAMPLAGRYRLLGELEAAGLTPRVSLDLHIALDLMQADQASKPCELFSDALTLIESSNKAAPFAPALASVASAPQPSRLETDADCEGLDARLAALKARPTEPAAVPTTPSNPVAAAEPAAPSAAKAKKKKKKKSGKGRDPAPPAAPEPEPAATVPKEPPKPPPAKPAAGSVATKLDDGLRNLD